MAVDLTPIPMSAWVRTDMGGPQANVEPEDAARQLAATISGLGPEHSGMFLHGDGTPHPW